MSGFLDDTHHLTKKNVRTWDKLINGKGYTAILTTKVCSNRFAAGYRSQECPNPALYMAGYEQNMKGTRSPPRARAALLPKAKIKQKLLSSDHFEPGFPL